VTAEVVCGDCAQRWAILVRADADLTAAVPRHEMGGPDPSTVIAAPTLAAELLKLQASIDEEVEGLDADRWRANASLIERVCLCANELGKFDDVALAAAGTGRADVERQQRWASGIDARLRADAPRIWAREAATRPPALATLTDEAIDAHERWVRSGRTGDGRLVASHVVVVPHRRLAGVDLRWSALDHAVLAGVDLVSTTFAGAHLTACDLRGARLERASFEGGVVTATAFDGANLGLTRWEQATVTAGSFERADLDRSSWTRAVVADADFRHAWFGHAALDGARFTDCDLSGAVCDLVSDQPMGTNRGFTLERCDLTGSTWTGRRVDEISVVDCRGVPPELSTA
jgi:uncharacterized protein YjbI with pentapeptide repeats